MTSTSVERMRLKGDKSGEMPVSNALTALTKANQVVTREGPYPVVWSLDS